MMNLLHFSLFRKLAGFFQIRLQQNCSESSSARRGRTAATKMCWVVHEDDEEQRPTLDRERTVVFKRSLWVWMMLPVVLAACVSKPTPIKYYDFGTAPKPKVNGPICSLPIIQLSDITSSNALSSNLMLYRLLYSDEQQVHAYANHRWNTTPVQLLTQRIKQGMARRGVRLLDSGLNNLNLLQLRLEVEDFNQYFIDAAQSYAQIQVRASLIRDRKLLAQTMFQQQVNADSADAPSGAKAMRLATDELVLNLTHWLCEQVGQ